MRDESAQSFRKFLNSTTGKKLQASTIIVDVDPQYTLEHYLQIAFKAGRESVTLSIDAQPINGLNPEQIVKIYNEVFFKKLLPVPQRLEIVRGRIKDAKKVKFPLELDHFRKVFEFKKEESVGKEEAWLEFETLCARKHFFKYLDKALNATKTGQQTITVNTKLF